MLRCVDPCVARAVSMQQSAYSHAGGGARGSPVASGGRKDGGEISAVMAWLLGMMTSLAGVSASAYFASGAAVGGGSDSPVHELRREVLPIKRADRPPRTTSHIALRYSS
jgi:hypothetical protein